VDAALSELEKMLNDEVDDDDDAGNFSSSSVADTADHRPATTVDCVQIPRLTAQLHYVRSFLVIA